jgi:phage antirepressor YoqD-like protein
MNNPIIPQFQSKQKAMSTREIAELCEKEHYHVKRDCETMFKGLKLDASNFGGIYFDGLNRQQTEYLLDEELTMTLVTGYSIVLRNRVIKRWKELEENTQKPAELSRMQLIQLALEAEQENQALRGQVAVLEPKAQALDTIANTENTYCIRECAKTIGIKESDLIQLLLDKKWCYRDADRKLQPIAQYVTNGVFANRASPVIKNRNDGKERVFLHMRVTAFGLTRITGLVERSKKLKVVA